MKTQNDKVERVPGPWETSVTSDGKEWAVCEAGGGDVIAEICSENPESDARLIAASPELFRELVAACDRLEALGEKCEVARAVIAKAEQ